jgi:hypothetical protein
VVIWWGRDVYRSERWNRGLLGGYSSVEGAVIFEFIFPFVAFVCCSSASNHRLSLVHLT